jgi:hypothetical protein
MITYDQAEWRFYAVVADGRGDVFDVPLNCNDEEVEIDALLVATGARL